GRTRALLVEKPLKIKVEFNGVYVCYSQTVGHHTVRTTSSADVCISFLACIRNKVISNKIVAAEIFEFDDTQLAFKPLPQFRFGDIVAPLKTFPCLGDEDVPIV